VTNEIRDLPKLMNKIIDEIERKKVMENFQKARIASNEEAKVQIQKLPKNLDTFVHDLQGKFN
jgi:hypothetical protein